MTPSESGTEGLLESAAAEVRAKLPASAAHFHMAREVLPGGTSRARFWWPIPIYLEHGSGAYVTDIDGNRYIDCNLGFGSMILGHRHPAVESALARQLSRGVFFGAATTSELALAELLAEHVPGAERIIFNNSGSEATGAALRIARAATGREKIAKFEGGWHGITENLVHSYTSVGGGPEQPAVIPEMPGIPGAVSATTIVLPFNDRHAFDIIKREAADLACVIVEPVQGGAGAMPAHREFLHELRQLCTDLGVLLVMDEVITGFRVGPRSGSGYYGVTGDLVTLGKILGGGLPAGAVCGRADLIDVTLPVLAHERPARRPVNVTGTFSGNPMTTVAGHAQLATLLGNQDSYQRLATLGDQLREGLAALLADLGIAAHVTGIGSIWGLHFSASEPSSVRDKQRDNQTASRLLAAYLLAEGVLMSAPVHLSFVSTAHDSADIDAILAAHRRALARMKEEGCV